MVEKMRRKNEGKEGGEQGEVYLGILGRKEKESII
jgi:hypothetical protein